MTEEPSVTDWQYPHPDDLESVPENEWRTCWVPDGWGSGDNE